MARIRNRTVRVAVFRTFAVLSLLYVGQGFWALGAAAYGARQTLSKRLVLAYIPHFYILFALCNVAFLLGLVVSAYYLWEMRHGAVRRTSILMIAMILYIFLKDVVPALPNPFGSSASLANLLGANAGLLWLELSGYPLVALVVLNAVKYYTRRSTQHGSTSKDGKRDPAIIA